MIQAFLRLYRGETRYDFAGRWRRWFAMSGTVILIGIIALGVRGLNFSVDFKGGTIWQVPTATATVAQARAAVAKVDASAAAQAEIQVQTHRSTHQRIIQVQTDNKQSSNSGVITAIRQSLANMAHTSTNAVITTSIGAAWGASITNKALKAVFIFLAAVAVYIWLRFEGKMAVAALTALVHDILVTVGIYALSGFQVSPDTVIAFLTILGYSLYDTIVVFDKVQENTKSLSSANRQTYTDVVNVSMNEVLARSINTSFVAIIPIVSILVIGAGLLGATTLADFGLALFIGLTTGAYSSIFIASPLLALLKEREPRYREIRRRLASQPGPRPVPATAGAARAPSRTAAPAARASSSSSLSTSVRSERAERGEVAPAGPPAPQRRPAPPRPVKRTASTGTAPVTGHGGGELGSQGQPPRSETERATGTDGTPPGAGTRTPVPPRSGNRPPPRPRKKKSRR